MKNERSIIFSARMVLAILAGRKTVTRRVIRHNLVAIEHEYQEWDEGKLQVWFPYGNVGDRLWVRENWRMWKYLDKIRPSRIATLCDGPPSLAYECDWNGDVKKRQWPNGLPMSGEWGRLRSAIHMPRWASRITLEIAGRSYEQLQEITEEGAVAEGFEATDTQTARESFAQLWDKISREREKWADNPWVWVVKFKRLEERG